MERKLVEHVIEKAKARVHVRLSGAIEIDAHPNLSLLGVALNRGGSFRVHFRPHLSVLCGELLRSDTTPERQCA